MTSIMKDCAEIKRLAELLVQGDIESREYTSKVRAHFDEIFARGRERRAHLVESALHVTNTELWRQIDEHRSKGGE